MFVQVVGYCEFVVHCSTSFIPSLSFIASRRPSIHRSFSCVRRAVSGTFCAFVIHLSLVIVRSATFVVRPVIRYSMFNVVSLESEFVAYCESSFGVERSTFIDIVHRR